MRKSNYHMPGLTATSFRAIICIVTWLGLLGCRNIARNVPLPQDETEFAQPTSRPFKFTEAKEIKWVITNPDSIKPSSEKKFDFNKLPSKPFDIGEALPLTQPTDEQKFDWNNLPDTVFNLNALPAQKIKFRTTLAGVPKIIKAGLPSVKQGGSRGIMEVGATMGLKGTGRCFLQDEYGQLWIGSSKGLWRYDGENWTVYSAEQGLIDENIFSILVDSRDLIWVGTLTGKLFILDRKAGLITQLIDTFHRQESVLGLMEDKEGQIWVSTNNSGVYIISGDRETIRHFGVKEGLMDNFSARLIQNRQGFIWITTGNGVHIIDLKSGKNKWLKKAEGLLDNVAVSLLQDSRDQIWIGTLGGVNIIDLRKQRIRHLSKELSIDSNFVVSSLSQSQDGKIWMGTEQGIAYCFDEKNSLLEKLHVADKIGADLKTADRPIIFDFIEDKDKQLWMGTINGGCYFINPNNGRSANFTSKDGLGDNRVWTVLEDDNGYIWLGTLNGIDVYNPVLRTIKHIGKEHGLLRVENRVLLQVGRDQIWSCGDGPGITIIDLKKGSIKQLGGAQGVGGGGNMSLINNKDQVWSGTFDGYVQDISVDGKAIKRAKITSLAEGRISTLAKDSRGHIWLGSNGEGVYVIDPEKNTAKHLGTQEGLLSNSVFAITEDSNGSVWIASAKGIDVANLKDGTLTSFTSAEGLAADDVYTLNEKNGRFYAGTSAGLSILTPAPGGRRPWKVISYGHAQGLSYLDFAENSTLFTKKGQFWGGVENQILTVIDDLRIDTTTHLANITGINILDQPGIFSNTTVAKNAIAGIDTLWKTEKDSFYVNKQLPLDTGYAQKNDIRWDSTDGPYHLPVNLRLPHQQNYLSFRFNGNHIADPDKVVYRYTLEGIDKNWSAVSANNISENYRDLPPGHYAFKVSSKGMNGLWSKPSEFRFIILPPWWKTWWAYSIYVLVVMGAIAWFMRNRSQKLRKENRILEEKVAIRTAELNKTLEGLKATQKQLIQSEKMASLGELTAGIAHEIQNPLNFVNNFSEINAELIDEMKSELVNGNKETALSIANSVKENEEKIRYHGKRADGIVKGMLQHSRTSTGIKEPTDINVLADEYLRLSYHGLRARDKSFNANFKADLDERLSKVSVVSQEVGRVLLNLFTNAFYSVTEKKKQLDGAFEPFVSVKTKNLGDKIEIRVRDNGLGISQKVLDKIFQPFFTTKPTGQGTGLGLSLSYDIITKAHGGELKVETKEGEFAEFIIILPNNT